MHFFKNPTLWWILFFLPLYITIFYVLWHIIYRAAAPPPKEPYVVLNNLTSNASSEAEIQWYSENEQKGFVFYSTVQQTQNPDVQPEYATNNKFHKVYLKNLFPNTKQFQQISDRQAIPLDLPYAFFTAKDKQSTKEQKILLVGDTQTVAGLGHMPLIQSAIAKNVPEQMPFLILGDFTWDGASTSYWNHFWAKSMINMRNKTIIPVLGNHDGEYVQPKNEGLQPQYFGYPNNNSSDPARRQDLYHSVDFGNAVLIILDFVANIALWEDQILWLKTTLIDNQDKDQRIVIGHRQIFNFAFSGMSQPFIEKVLPILDKQNASLQINGHVHTQYRINIKTPQGFDIPEVCVGTGGGWFDFFYSQKNNLLNDYEAQAQFLLPAPIYAILTLKEDKSLKIEAFNQFGDIIDEFSITNNNGKIKYLSGLKPINTKNFILISAHITTLLLGIICLLLIVIQFIVSQICRKNNIEFKIFLIENNKFTEMLPFSNHQTTDNRETRLEAEVSREQQLVDSKIGESWIEKTKVFDKRKFAISLSFSIIMALLISLKMTLFIEVLTIIDKIGRLDCFEQKDWIQFASAIPILLISCLFQIILLNFYECRIWRIFTQLCMIVIFIQFINESAINFILSRGDRIDVFFALPFINFCFYIIFEFGGLFLFQFIASLLIRCKSSNESFIIKIKWLFLFIFGHPEKLLEDSKVKIIENIKKIIFSNITLFVFAMIGVLEWLLWLSGLSLSSLFRLNYVI